MPSVPDQAVAKYWTKREQGAAVAAAAREAGFSTRTAFRLEKSTGVYHEDAIEAATAPQAPRPKYLKKCSAEARRAATTFAYFQRRYFGRRPIGWQIEAAEKVVQYLESPDEEYLVVNAPPGSGKSTCWTHDLPCWVTVRNRAIRGQVGSLTQVQASQYVARIRRSLERTIPQVASQYDLKMGLAFDAEATLAMDYGRFEPMQRDLWTRTRFVVMQTSGGSITEKEPTWSSFGKDSAFLGGRWDLVIWDDLTDPTKIRTAIARDDLKEWYSDIAETRLEPGGLLVLQGQRTGPDDIYRYALDQVGVDFDDEGEPTETDVRKYHHLVFRVHTETKCKGAETHSYHAESWPEGCLLDPKKLGWKKISGIMANRSERFRVLYQQEDSDPSDTLVLPEWIFGGGDSPGCLTKERGLQDPPCGLGQCLSVVTCDPSPSNKWGVIWWLVEPETKMRYLIDLFNGKMEAPGLLDYNQSLGRYTGLMQEWQDASMRLGIPITHWVVEVNAAQKFLLQYEHARRWRDLNRIQIISHTTGRNKSDPEFGVETIAPGFQYGRYRLPYKLTARGPISALIGELTRYGHVRTDDLVMATWFLDWNLPNLHVQRRIFKNARRPSWLLKERLR